MSWDAIIVGGGIVGGTVSAALRGAGMSVLTLDDARAGAGTPPSGGHLKPSWFGGMPRAEYEPAMELLARVWGMTEERFIIQEPLLGVGLKRVTIYRVDTDKFRADVAPYLTPGTVTSVRPGRVTFTDLDGDVVEAEAPLIVVAAGSWTDRLVPVKGLEAKKGVSFRLGAEVPEGIVRPWAPYKQVVVHQQSPGEVWAGDGSALLAKNWTAARTVECLARCRRVVGEDAPTLETRTGLRPYCPTVGKTDPCLLRETAPGVWAATGAGKSGTIAAGWVAVRLLETTGA